MLFILLAPSVDYTIHLTKISILKCEGLIEKNSYECRAYEPVDGRSLSYLSHKSTENRIDQL